MAKQKTVVFALILLGLVSAAGCATHPGKPSQNAANPCAAPENPKQGSYLDDWNRANFGIDLPLFKYVFRPVGKAYQKVTPEFLRQRIHNFFDNIGQVAVIANDLLQGRGVAAGRTSGRFLVNSTVGLLGTFDVASHMGLGRPAVHQDFGLTLARWGVGEGPYLVLPVLGPTTTRDALSPGVDGILFDPITYVPDHNRAVNVLLALGFLNSASDNVNNFDRMIDAIDPYVFTRSAYLQHRRFLVQQNGGGPPPSTSIECYLQP